MEHETFFSLLRDSAHWEFEIFSMIIFDGLLLGLLWPFIRKHWIHHLQNDVAAGHIVDSPFNYKPYFRSKDFLKLIFFIGLICIFSVPYYWIWISIYDIFLKVFFTGILTVFISSIIMGIEFEYWDD